MRPHPTHTLQHVADQARIRVAIRDRNDLDTSAVDDVVLGGVEPVGEQGADIARVAALDAGYDETVAGVQINRFCASGLEAVNMASGQVMSVTRVARSKEAIPMENLGERVPQLLDAVQAEMLARYRAMHRDNTHEVDSYDNFKERIDAGGFFLAHWCGSGKCEARVKEDTKATIRCIPLDATEEKGKCLVDGEASSRRVIFARAY